MLFYKLRRDLNALADKVVDAVRRITDTILGHTRRIEDLERRVASLEGDLRQAWDEVREVTARFEESEEFLDAIDEDVSELLAEVLTDADVPPTKACPCPNCVATRLLTGNKDAGLTSGEVDHDAISCKITLVEKKKDFNSALAEVQADIQKAKKRQKGKKKA